jgi:Cysteine-rich secretory protein family/PAN domain
MLQRFGLSLAAILILAATSSFQSARAETQDTEEPGIDRPGGDIKSFDFQGQNGSFITPELACNAACRKDKACKGWTLVKAGVQGPKPKCYLKNVLNPARKDACCTSGVIGAVQCEPGKVFRDSYDGDGLCVQNVCVTPQMRADAIKADYAKANDNLLSDDPQDFQGEWAMTTGQGSASTLQLSVNGNNASGSFRVTDHSEFNGTLSGTIKHYDKTGGQFVRLAYKSKQPQADGHGNLKVYKDGRIEGGITWRPQGATQDRYTSWNGKLISRDFNIDYGACPGCTAGGGGTSSNGGGEKVPAEWTDMLAVHNEKRAIHCVPPLTWSAPLAKAAQDYADKCILGTHGSTGENLANFLRTETKNGVETAVLPAASNRTAFQDAWYCEGDHYDYDNPQFKGGFKSGCGPEVTGHFTQIVWKNSTQLGCGRATCDINGKKGTAWVCRYNPPGNFNAQDPNVLRAQVLPPTCK